MKKRAGNYDLMRIVATVAVILVHVSSLYSRAYTNPDGFGAVYTDHLLSTTMFYVLPRYSVVAFLMLSGAFVLADDRNADFKYFYRKSVKSILMPTIVFTILYFLYSMLEAGAAVAINHRGYERLLNPVYTLLKGKAFYHLWYLYMLIGIYILVPIVVRLKNSISEKAFSTVTWIFLIWASLSDRTSSHINAWDLGVSFCYLSAFLAGYEVRKWADAKEKSNLKGIILVVLGFAVEVAAGFACYYKALNGADFMEFENSFVGRFSPVMVLSGVLIFAGFAIMNIKGDYGKIGGATFYIFLWHAGVWDIGYRFIGKYVGITADSRIVMSVSVVVVFFVSYVLSLIYMKWWKHFDNKFHVVDKLCKKLHLD